MRTPAGTTRQLPFEQFRGPCPHTSNGQPCRYYADHDPTPHTYGGGLGDHVRNRHCDDPQTHTPHAWTDDKAWFNCSGSPLETRTQSICQHCGDPIQYHRAARAKQADMGMGHPWWAHTDGRVYCGSQYGTDKAATPTPQPTPAQRPPTA